MSEVFQYLLGAGQLAVLGGIFHRMGNLSARISFLENSNKPSLLKG
jgi:hypothetical protein